MKGKNTFTTSEAEKIKELIAEKCEAEGEEQNRIRAKIRRIGFYYTDFSTKKGGYTKAFFESLVSSGKIKIT